MDMEGSPQERVLDELIVSALHHLDLILEAGEDGRQALRELFDNCDVVYGLIPAPTEKRGVEFWLLKGHDRLHYPKPGQDLYRRAGVFCRDLGHAAAMWQSLGDGLQFDAENAWAKRTTTSFVMIPASIGQIRGGSR